MAELYFLAMVLGLPALVLAIALLAGRLYRGGPEELLDWRPTRSPETEVELECSDVQQMLAALNRYRRSRGVPERTLEELAARLRGS